MVAVPSGPGAIAPPSTVSTTNTCASISARTKAGRSDGSCDARTRACSMSFSGSNMIDLVMVVRAESPHGHGSGCLRELRLRLGEGPVEPLRQNLHVLGL